MIPSTIVSVVKRVAGEVSAEMGDDLAAAEGAVERFADAVDGDPIWCSLRPWLSEREVLAVAILACVELEPTVATTVATRMAPAGPRPDLGFLVAAARLLWPDVTVGDLVLGRAAEWGLLQLGPGDQPLPARPASTPSAIALALGGRFLPPAGSVLGASHLPDVPLPPSILEEVRRRAAGLDQPGRALVVRSGSEIEAAVVAAAIAQAAGRAPCFVTTPAPGLGAWLELAGALPIFTRRPAPGEIARLPDLPGWHGPILAAAGLDGAVDGATGALASWRVPVPEPEERVTLWSRGVPRPAAESLGRRYRHGPGRIAELLRLADQEARTEGNAVGVEHVARAAWSGEGGGLATLAQPLETRVPDAALVLPTGLKAELDLLLERCRLREQAARGLGPAMTTRLRSGVRAVFVGPSGTGKTLAAGWLAGRLGMPGWRVDIAAISSKYIGETEKNLSELLGRAEAAEVVLFFDEADSLFGKRTEVRQSTDRFANAQTNYLLERIERYDGIIVLASNSVQRFDAAFSRRLDVFVEFPPPGPEDRRALWRAHLGDTPIELSDLNLISAHCDLAGGHIRNATMAAAVLAAREGRTIRMSDLVAGLAAEYRKLGRSLPNALAEAARVAKP